jgi:DNA-directed RNA polymerase
VCIELSDALKTSDPAAYISNIPIHQDGSCNGLQHYAALGGDELGATAVNLAPADRPDDIYTKIAKQVQILIDEDVEKEVPEALLMQKRVNRKLVKQSVMTNTYGVTFIGAREQIKNRLKEARDNESPATALTDEQLKTCAAYSARLVFKSMDHMFEGARELQLWLNRAASLVTKSLSKEAIENENLQFYDELIKEGIISKNEKYLSSENDDDSDLLMDAVAQDTQSALKSAKKNEEEEYDDTFEDRAPVTIKKNKPARMTSMIWTSPLGMPIVQPYRKEFISQVFIS